MVQTLRTRREVKLHISPPRLEPGSQEEWFADALALPDERLREALRRQIEAEYELPTHERRRAVVGRLRAWLRLGERAHRLVAAYEAATASLPRRYEVARLEAERDAIMNELSRSEFEALRRVLPWLRTWSTDLGEEPGPSETDRTLALGGALMVR
ncbi:MAG TPA: hypothetical protein VNN10_09575 [Dehalococcoidia bacterium]|nr:hypothetical protein [Dehalococcoidia bacterium]